MKTGIWMSYDLGVQGDYPHLYEWLDDLGAVECGNSVAYFQPESLYKVKQSQFLVSAPISMVEKWW